MVETLDALIADTPIMAFEVAELLLDLIIVKIILIFNTAQLYTRHYNRTFGPLSKINMRIKLDHNNEPKGPRLTNIYFTTQGTAFYTFFSAPC